MNLRPFAIVNFMKTKLAKLYYFKTQIPELYLLITILVHLTGGVHQPSDLGLHTSIMSLLFQLKELQIIVLIFVLSWLQCLCT